MVNLLFSILVIACGIPMIINPKKITEREKCKIKSEMTIRIFGIILVVLRHCMFFYLISIDKSLLSVVLKVGIF